MKTAYVLAASFALVWLAHSLPAKKKMGNIQFPKLDSTPLEPTQGPQSQGGEMEKAKENVEDEIEEQEGNEEEGRDEANNENEESKGIPSQPTNDIQFFSPFLHALVLRFFRPLALLFLLSFYHILPYYLLLPSTQTNISVFSSFFLSVFFSYLFLSPFSSLSYFCAGFLLHKLFENCLTLFLHLFFCQC